MVQWLTRRTTDREVTGSNPVRHKHTEFGRERLTILLQIPPAPSFFSKKIPLYEPRFGIVPRQVMLSVAYPILIDVRFHNNLLLVYMYSCLYLV